MALNIESDVNRFKGIVRGRVRRDLKKYMSSGELIGRKGKEKVSIPLPQIDLPRFKYGKNEEGGVGAGEGEEGDPVGEGEGDGTGEAGDQPGEHVLEVEITIEELAEIMAEELELPKIEPKGEAKLEAIKDKYTGIRSVGPESLRHFKRTYRRALTRQISSGTYDPANPIIVPIQEDKRYRSWKTVSLPERNAVVIYMMDVSGSMGQKQKDIVRSVAFWIDTWLSHQYEGLEQRFIIHDASARMVDRETFFHTKESGGTLISTAYKLCNKLIDEEFPATDWNIYPFHFSDGDNWSGNDTNQCIELMRDELIPKSNMFCYGQVDSDYGSGQFLRDLQTAFTEGDEDVIWAKIEDNEGIYDAIKTFLGKGK
jgi:uncharacterized protein